MTRRRLGRAGNENKLLRFRKFKEPPGRKSTKMSRWKLHQNSAKPKSVRNLSDVLKGGDWLVSNHPLSIRSTTSRRKESLAFHKSSAARQDPALHRCNQRFGVTFRPSASRGGFPCSWRSAAASRASPSGFCHSGTASRTASSSDDGA